MVESCSSSSSSSSRRSRLICKVVERGSVQEGHFARALDILSILEQRAEAPVELLVAMHDPAAPGAT